MHHYHPFGPLFDRNPDFSIFLLFISPLILISIFFSLFQGSIFDSGFLSFTQICLDLFLYIPDSFSFLAFKAVFSSELNPLASLMLYCLDADGHALEELVDFYYHFYFDSGFSSLQKYFFSFFMKCCCYDLNEFPGINPLQLAMIITILTHCTFEFYFYTDEFLLLALH